jgi:hypothetical protein
MSTAHLLLTHATADKLLIAAASIGAAVATLARRSPTAALP